MSDAGDVNGDGFADLIVGAPDAHPHGAYSGAAYVIFGKAGGFAANLGLSALDDSNGFKISGVAEYDRAGISVSSAGDVNGDGFDDVIVGATGARGKGGAAYVIFGKAGGFAAKLNLSSLDGTSGFTLSDGGVFTAIGVSGAGDVNGDGFDDVIVGSPYEVQYGVVSRGAAYVVFGKAGGFPADFDLFSLDGANGFKLSNSTAEFSGLSVGGAGDMNGDGFADVIVGASQASPNGTFSGRAYVIFGKAAGFSADLDLSDVDGTNGFKLNGVAAYDRAGIAVSGAGDINGDGFADVIIGASEATGDAYGSGVSYVVFGKPGGFPTNVELSSLDGGNGFASIGVTVFDRSGASVRGAGDINGDGFADVIVGAPHAESGAFASGASYVVFGKAEGFPANLKLSALDGRDGFAVGGSVAFDRSGTSVSAAGDVNGDGFNDIIIGAPGNRPNGSSDIGAAYVVFGGDPGRLMIAKSGQTAHFTDVDGDRVTITTSAGMFTKEMFDMRAEGLGFQFEGLHLTDPWFTKTNLTFSAQRQDATGDGVKDGNKMVNVGFIDGSGVNLGAVTIPGDLGQIDAFKIKTLSISSLGAFGTTTQDATAPSLHSDITSGITTLNITHDIGSGVTLAIGGRLGTATIGGNLDGATLTVGGAVGPMTAADAMAISSLTIGGHVNDSNILAGYDLAGLPANADVSIGSVIVRGAWSASNLVAGIIDSTGDGFGRNDTLIPGGMDGLVARIATIKIKGMVSGSSEMDEFFGITAESIGKARFQGALLPLTPSKDDLLLDEMNGNFRLVEVEA